MRSDVRQHYVYLHCRESTGEVFYVGKGKDRRAWQRSGRNSYWKRIADKHGVSVRIYQDGLPECCALSLERAVVAALGRDRLANLVDGGGGISGWKHSEETRRRIGSHWKGRKLTPAMKAALDQYNAGKKLTDEHKAKLSAAKKGKKRPPRSAETRAKISASHMGIRPSEDSRRKMSLAKIGKAVGRDSPSYDHTIRNWENKDGDVFSGTRADFIKQFNLGGSCVSAVINGRQKSVKGWTLK